MYAVYFERIFRISKNDLKKRCDAVRTRNRSRSVSNELPPSFEGGPNIIGSLMTSPAVPERWITTRSGSP